MSDFMYIGMKSENQNVGAGKSSQKRLMFVHISARSNLMTLALMKGCLVFLSHQRYTRNSWYDDTGS
jgi:hypothetical protein